MKRRGFVLAVLSAIVAHGASGQSYPQKPVHIVVPFAVGSATDTVGRVLAQGLSERMKVPFIVDNRPGANGVIAGEFTARSAADGYTVLLATVSTHSQVPWLVKKLSYDPIKDFLPIAGIGGFSFLIVVSPTLPAKTMQEFVAYVRANPGKVSYGAPGGTSQICSELLRRHASLDLQAIPYKSSPQALTELMADQTGMVCSDFATAVPLVKAGKLRALAITTSQRSSELPAVPTLKEVFGEFIELRSWIGAVAPAGTSREAIIALGREIAAITKEPEFKTKLAPLGFDLLPLDEAQLAAFMQAELAKWGTLIKQVGIEPQ